MNWKVHHRISEQHAMRAHSFVAQRQFDLAQQEFHAAATAEMEALATLDSSTPKTMGILAVSAVALFYKAGMFGKAFTVATDYLQRTYLLSGSRAGLEDLREMALGRPGLTTEAPARSPETERDASALFASFLAFAAAERPEEPSPLATPQSSARRGRTDVRRYRVDILVFNARDLQETLRSLERKFRDLPGVKLLDVPKLVTMSKNPMRERARFSLEVEVLNPRSLHALIDLRRAPFGWALRLVRRD